MGHWLDLLHTFDGGCNNGRPRRRHGAGGLARVLLPRGRDTCAEAGLDPITNFMDYTQDNCMFEFTEGQAARMQQGWAAFRA